MELGKEILQMLGDIKGQLIEQSKKLDEHSTILKEHSTILNEHSTILKEHSTILNEHSTILKEHSTILNEHSTILKEHSATLKEHGIMLKDHSTQLSEHRQILGALMNGQEMLKAEMSELRLQSAKEFGELKEQLKSKGDIIDINVLKEEIWSNKKDIHHIKTKIGII